MNEGNKDFEIISVLPKITQVTKTVIPSLRNIGAESVGGLSNMIFETLASIILQMILMTD